MNLYIAVIFLVLNIVTFLIYGYDKKKAQMNQWRVSEKTLIFLACFGGSVGAYLGMQFFHHKTKKPLFKLGIPMIFILQICGIFYYFVMVR